MENVGMLVHRGLREVLGSLAEIGYNAEWQDIRAEDVGAPHKRERIWIVAYPRCEHGERDKIIQKYEKQNRQRNAIEFKRPIKCNWEGIDKMAYSDGFGCLQRQDEIKSTKRRKPAQCDIGTESEVADTSEKGLQRYGAKYKLSEIESKGEIGRSGDMADTDNASRTCRRQDSGMGLLKTDERKTNRRTWKRINQWSTEPDVDRLAYGVPGKLDGDIDVSPEGFTPSQNMQLRLSENPRTRKRIEAVGWQNEPDIERLTTGINRRVDRLKGLGNAIVPQIACMLFERIKPNQLIHEE